MHHPPIPWRVSGMEYIYMHKLCCGNALFILVSSHIHQAFSPSQCRHHNRESEEQRIYSLAMASFTGKARERFLKNTGTMVTPKSKHSQKAKLSIMAITLHVYINQRGFDVWLHSIQHNYHILSQKCHRCHVL